MGGWLAARFGGKFVYGIGVTVTTVLTLLTPLAASVSRHNVTPLIVLRIVEGLGEVSIRQLTVRLPSCTLTDGPKSGSLRPRRPLTPQLTVSLP